MDGGVVPIVPAAVIFDLPVGGWQCRPTAEFGYRAAEAAGVVVATGTVGAGVQYDAEVPILMSEIDPVQNAAVSAARVARLNPTA